MHSGNGDITDLGRRFVDCFVAALDDAGLPAEQEFRAAMRAYMVWAVDDVLTYSPVGSRGAGGHLDAALVVARACGYCFLTA